MASKYSSLSRSNIQDISFPICNYEVRFIPNTDHFYCMSRNGRVWSRLGGRGVVQDYWHELKTCIGARKYYVVSLSIRKKLIQFKIHNLLLETFVSPRPPGAVSRHLDDNRTNNSFDNICWGTYSENNLDRSRNGNCVGESHWKSKLTKESVLFAREMRPKGYTNNQIKKMIFDKFGIDVSEGIISFAIIGRTWKNI